jgi:beta-mannosidase
MKSKLFTLLLFVVFQAAAQQTDLKSFVWNLHSDTVSLTNIDPSDVYMALLSKGVIAEPFYRDNENKLQWVAKHDWVFETDFDLTANVRNHDKVEMVFEGLDTYARVYLNGTLILSADNMFRVWYVDVKSILQKHNQLKVVFTSPLKVIEAARRQGKWKLPYDYGYVRKAPYHFGWDWGPTFITCGIWRPAYIRVWDATRLDDVFVEQRSVNSFEAQAEVTIAVEAAGMEIGELLLFRDSTLISKLSVELYEGKNRFSLSDRIIRPKLWWPNGLGEPNQYVYRVEFKRGDRILDSKEVKTGFRSIEVIQESDSTGKSFYFRVNGVPVFAKGANYIPPDNFLSRVSDEKYEQIITDARKANMNMLRVWGGGTYEKDLFYQLCDENGMMVWQDFMFACNMSPGDSAFIANVKKEAEENVVRLRNHSSIVLWCGNNEVDEAWHNWGWQKSYDYSAEDSSKLWNAYLDIFEKMLPEVIQTYSPGTFYWPSSPSIGWGHNEAFKQGDVHYWEVWWGRVPFINYEKKIGRFMSEYGFQGMPDMRTIEAFTLPEDREMSSKVLNVHQKHPFGWEAIKQYMKRDFPVPESLEDYDYVSQLLQAYGIGMAIEAHRRAKPYCMGTLYWQLNDCWPVVSWSSFDYYGRWKALHYQVKHDYAPLLISFDKTDDGFRVWVISDEPASQKAVLQWKLLDFDGVVLKQGDRDLLIEKNSSDVVYRLSRELLSAYDTTAVFLNAKLLSEDVLLAENNYFFAKPKNLKLKNPEISIDMEHRVNGYVIFLTSQKFAKGVYMSTSVDGLFGDNYFDLLPGEVKSLFFETTQKLTSADIKVKTLFDIE